ncbi:MAG: hypothetical protein D6705_06480 [Deltaproteobacteria bacterium]|nr:MAG: hypothetical protein D6705_06480 [Deltaproteobacteria bacterium]
MSASVCLRKGPGYCVELVGDDLVVRLWWSFGRPNPATWKGVTAALSDALGARIGHRVVLDLREAPPVGSRAVRRGIERLLAIATMARRPVVIGCGPTSIQRRDVLDLAATVAPDACIRFPASALPAEPDLVAA